MPEPTGDEIALRRLLEDAALRARLVQAARHRLDEQFSLPRAVDQVEALLQGLVEQCPR